MAQANVLQLLVNQEAWTTTGCLRTICLSAPSMETILWTATVQPKNRQRRFGYGYRARLMQTWPEHPNCDWAETHQCPRYTGRTEGTVMLEKPETNDPGCCGRRGRGRAGRAEPGLTFSQRGRGWTVAQWCGETANPGWTSQLSWTTTRRYCKGAGIGFREVDNTRAGHNLHKQPSGRWPQRSLAPARRTHFRRESTPLPCGVPGPVPPWR